MRYKFLILIFLYIIFGAIKPSFGEIILQDDFNYTGSPTAHGWSYSGSAVEVGSWGKTGNGVRIRYTSQNTAPYELSKSVSSLNLSEVYVEFDFKVPTNAVGGAKFLKLFGKKNAPVGVANTTFGLLYSNTTFKEISYGTGDTSTTNDTATIIYYNGVYESWHAYDPLVNLQVARGSVNPKDNVWRKYKAYMKYNTNGNRDGEYKVWINDVLWVHATNVKNRHVDNSRFFDKISFGDYTSGGGDWYLYIDNVVISGTPLDDPNPPTPYTLTVSKNGTGTGSISSAPAGINCGSTCNADFNSDSNVTLTFTADGGSTISSVSGCTLSGNQCTLNMGISDKNVVATFNTIASPAEFNWSSSTYAVNEADGNTVVGRINRTVNTSGTASVYWQTLGITADGKLDYMGIYPTLVEFADGETFKDVYLTILQDLEVEETETTELRLSSPVNGILGSNYSAILSIVDDDTEVVPVGDEWLPYNNGYVFSWAPDVNDSFPYTVPFTLE